MHRFLLSRFLYAEVKSPKAEKTCSMYDCKTITVTRSKASEAKVGSTAVLAIQKSTAVDKLHCICTFYQLKIFQL